jgi:predicted glycoside hydrolase/deacetylase ChbG (UPF0249 family)
LIRLAVNADDFGFTRDVNDGIVESHRRGILTSTTLMANAPAFDHAVKLAQANPTLDVGCHLVLIGGPGVTGGSLPSSIPALLQALALNRLPIYEELAAQVRRIIAAGIQPTHLDTHKHTHLAPPVLRAVARIAREFGIPWVRRPFDFAPIVAAPFGTRLARRLMRIQSPRFARTLAGLRTTDHFVGFTLTGRLGPAEMVRALQQLPPGFTEFMVHPGFCRDELRAAPTRLKDSRAREMEALVSPQVRRVIEDRQIVLTGFQRFG